MRLITWNVQWCCGLDGRVDPGRILSTARALGDFDVLCLQEVADNYPALKGDAGHDQPALLAAGLPGYSAFYGPAIDEWRPGSDGGGSGDGDVRQSGKPAEARRSRFGNLILSRLPIVDAWTLRLPWPIEPGVPSMPRSCTVATVESPALGRVRIMTTHLEYHGSIGRLAQARALVDHHREACAQALAPPPGRDDGTPFRPRAHTTRAILCGDFNAVPTGPEHAALTSTPAAPGLAGPVGPVGPVGPGFVDAWSLVSPAAPQPPTFKVHDQTYGPTPIACDFIFVSADLAPRVRAMRIDGRTRASDHQPVLIELR